MIHTLSKKNVISNILALFTGTAFAQFSMALTLFLTARSLGIDAFGQYAACFSLSKLSAVLFDLGLDTRLLRESRRGVTSLGNLVGSNLVIKSALGTVWISGIFIISNFLNKQTYPQHLLYIAAVTVWLEAVLNTAIFAFNSALRNQITALLTITSSLSLLFVTITFIASQQASPLIFATARLVIMGLATCGAYVLLARKFRLSSNRDTIIRTLREIIPYTLSNALLLIYTQADITIIAILLGKKATGIYSLASSIVRALFVIPQAIHVVMLPVLGQLIAENSRKLEKTFQRMVLSQVVIGATLWLGLGLFGPLLVWLILGDEFAASGNLVAILSSILFIKSSSHGLAAMIVATGFQSHRVVVQGFAAILNVALNFWVVNRFGVTGVAWVYMLSELILLLGYMFLVERWRSRTPDKSLATP